MATKTLTKFGYFGVYAPPVNAAPPIFSGAENLKSNAQPAAMDMAGSESVDNYHDIDDPPIGTPGPLSWSTCGSLISDPAGSESKE